MSKMIDDLWPKEFELPGLRAPVNILKSQASLLGQKTNNIVEADVIRFENEHDTDPTFMYGFRIVAPALGWYRYLLFSIEHDIGLYPVRINLGSDLGSELGRNEPLSAKNTVTAESEERFIELLKKIFSAHKTKQVITAIKIQSVDDPTLESDEEDIAPF